MRTDSSHDLTTLRSEVATRIDPFVGGVADETLEERCRLYLQALRWPAGVECPRCSEHTRLLWLESRSKWHCYSCRYQFSITAGTLFHHSHLAVWKWLAAVHLMLDSPEGISAGELRRRLGGSYKTAWFAAHRIRAAMRGRGEGILRTLVEVELERPPGETPAQGVWSDIAELSAGTIGLGDSARTIDLGDEDQAAHLGRLLAGPHHHLSAKHLLAYLDERRWRFAHRGNPHVFRDTILALLGGEGLSYVQLVAER
jgi:transposase-like protein